MNRQLASRSSDSRCRRWMHSQAGFTLIEILVVVSIIVILMLAVVPRISRMLEQSRVESSVNLIVATVSAGKAFAMRPIQFDGAEYSGCALIFTPSGRIRIVENRDYFIDDEASPRDLERDLDYDGYADIGGSVDYVRLPDDLLVLGMSRGGGGSGEVKLLAPPFAIRINQYGNLQAGANIGPANYISGNSEQRSRQSQVFYDANYDNTIDFNYSGSLCYTAYDRENPIGGGVYNPNDWDVRRSDSVPIDPQTNNPHLPFEQIEALRGVVLVGRTDFEKAAKENPAITLDANSSFAGALPDATRDWVMDHGIVIQFNQALDVMINKPDE